MSDDAPVSWNSPAKGNLFDKLISFLPSYLLMAWHNVWYIGLISVYLTLCYKLIVVLLSLEIVVK
jgi:hypothetical protein